MSCSLIQTIDSTECVGNSLVKINSNFSSLETAVCNLQSSTSLIPVGGILMYSGSLGNFDGSGRGLSNTDVYPFGICNGNTYGTIFAPDLRDRFIVGAGLSYNIGDSNSLSLSAVGLVAANLPPHSHTIAVNDTGSSAGQNNLSYVHTSIGGSDPNTFNSSLVGSGVPHENRPPYYALAYIIRVV